jgi:mycothione reductase
VFNHTVPTDQSSAGHYDLIIIGSGSANAIPAYLSDWKIAIVERGTFGGTCLNVGCIPSKMFVLPADMAEEANHSHRLGIDVRFHGADWRAIRDRVFGRIDPIAESGRQYRANGSENITLIEGTARFVAPRVLDIEGQRFTADHILVGAGARPVVPPIPGLVETGFHTSDSIMRLDELPERLGIIGGGYIAVEMGHVFASFGSKVSLFNRSRLLLRGQDLDISERFTDVFSKRVDVHLEHLPSKIERRADVIDIH